MIAELRRGREDESAVFMVDLFYGPNPKTFVRHRAATITLREWDWMQERVRDQMADLAVSALKAGPQ